MTMRLLIVTVMAISASAQERPGLFFREDWKEIPAATPVTQEHVVNPQLVVSLHGPGKALIKKSHHDKPLDDPYYIWSGDCTSNWAVSLRDKDSFVDLSGLAKVRWRSKQAGYRQLRLMLKLANGQWIIGDQADGPSVDWRLAEFNIGDQRWRRLDIKTVVEGPWVEKPDLSRVDEIGWTDLMPGGGSIACSRLDWIEVDGKKIPRK